MRTFDSNYSDWKVGDKVVWCDKRDICPLFTITEINVPARWAFWEDSRTRQGSQWENLLRVTETKIDTASLIGLEKLINDLCEQPSLTLHGDETITVRYATHEWTQPFSGRDVSVVLGDWDETIELDPTQALTLLDYLKEQRGNLEQLRDALQAKKAEEEATRKQRDAERLTALKVKHSEAVTAWQQGGCVGQCPSFEATR